MNVPYFLLALLLVLAIVISAAYGNWGSQLWAGRPVSAPKVLAVLMFIGSIAAAIQGLIIAAALMNETAIWLNLF